MSETKGAAQTSAAGVNWNTGTSGWDGLWRVWVGPALAGSQTITGATAGWQVGIAIQQSNAQMNLYAQHFVYLWRSGTGNAKTFGGPTVHSNGDYTSETGSVNTFTGAAGDVTTTLNDRVVVELWGDNQNTKSTNYTGTIYYDGTTQVVNTTATSDAASFLYSPITLSEPAGAGQPTWRRFGGVPGGEILQGQIGTHSHKIW